MVEYFVENMWQMWALISLMCLILELTSGDFFIICFAIGGLFASAVAALGFGWVGQVIVCALFSLLSIFFVRPVALRYLHKGEKARVSNADALIDRIGTVSETIEPKGYGRVAIDGDDWKAKSMDESEIQKGESVRVVGRESLVVMVEKVGKSAV
ncbi:MAG: NfeD family protein [Prevotella sp.]|nr:NfeD family protein [Prevotella sp.]